MNGEGHERATIRLDELQATLEAASNYDEDALWYRVRYTQAVAWLGHEPKEKARKAAVDLCAKLLDRLANIDHLPRRKRSTMELRDFLRSVAPRSFIVLASALQEEGQRQRAKTDAKTQCAPLKAALTKLLAPLKALLKRLSSALLGEDRPPCIATSVNAEMLKKQLIAFADHPCDTNVSQEFHHQVTHPAIVAYVIAKYGTMDFYTAYNVACYYARIHEWSKVEQYLRTAVELGGEKVREQALRDPALKTYLADKENRARLDKLAEGLEDPKPTPAGATPSKAPSTAAKSAASN